MSARTHPAHPPVRRRRTGWSRVATAVLSAITWCTAVAGPVAAVPADDTPGAGPARIIGIDDGTDGLRTVHVYSAAMDTVLSVAVIPARDVTVAAPTLYLLNGAAGGSGNSSWHQRTGIAGFFAGEQVTVVIPLGGSGSYFTDWRFDDPVLGRQRWTTFLTRELPPLIDRAFNGTGLSAVAGISMAATSVFQLALADPRRYVAIGSYSGCIRTSDPVGRVMVGAVVGRWGGDANNMWGPPPDPAWASNDPYLRAEELRGTTMYVATGTGLPGPFDTPNGPGIGGDIGKLVDQTVVGGLLEAVTNQCAYALRDRLNELRIPAVFDLRPTGTHSWGYWEQDLYRSWPLFRDALAGGR